MIPTGLYSAIRTCSMYLRLSAIRPLCRAILDTIGKLMNYFVQGFAACILCIQQAPADLPTVCQNQPAE